MLEGDLEEEGVRRGSRKIATGSWGKRFDELTVRHDGSIIVERCIFRPGIGHASHATQIA